MPKPRDAASLRDAIRSNAFTPAVRDVDTLVTLLGDADADVARLAERALTRAGAPILDRLFRRLEKASSGERAHGFRVVGSLAPTDAAAARPLIDALVDADPQVQRAAARALGRLSGSEAKADIGVALLRAWDDAPPLPLARAIAEAMGKLGIPAARERLAEMKDGDAELVRVARRAEAMLQRDGSRGEVSEIEGERPADAPVDVVLLCRGGLEKIVAAELRERCPTATAVKQGEAGSGRVTAVWEGPPGDLYKVRTLLGFGFTLPATPVGAKETPVEAAARLLTSAAARRVLENWTRGTVRYRLDWSGEGHRRGATWQVVHALTAAAPSWVNDPSESTWEVSIHVEKGTSTAWTLGATLIPRKLADPRFTYRVRDVPAASHPTIAAALVRASGVRAGDVVWDPFVGSGSELVERARAGPCLALFGSDVEVAALEAARTNLEAARVMGVTLSIGDATRYAPPRVTRIITNPPMGRRVARDGSLAELLDRFTDHVAGVLRPGGSLTWLSPMGGRTAERAEARGFQVTMRQVVDLGGFGAELQVWTKGR